MHRPAGSFRRGPQPRDPWMSSCWLSWVFTDVLEPLPQRCAAIEDSPLFTEGLWIRKCLSLCVLIIPEDSALCKLWPLRATQQPSTRSTPTPSHLSLSLLELRDGFLPGPSMVPLVCPSSKLTAQACKVTVGGHRETCRVEP